MTAIAPDRAGLRRALESANIPCLLMVLVQLTGDRRWLAAPYAPTRGRGMDPHDDGGLPVERQAEVRDAAARAVAAWEDGAAPAIVINVFYSFFPEKLL